MSRSYACSDQHHEGDRLIRNALDAYEIRLEARRLVDQRGRRNAQLVGVICSKCLPFRMSEMQGLKRQSQSALFFIGDKT